VDKEVDKGATIKIVLNSSQHIDSRGCNPKALWLPAEKESPGGRPV